MRGPARTHHDGRPGGQPDPVRHDAGHERLHARRRTQGAPALARRIEEQNANGGNFRISLWTGASTSAELDGALAKVHGIERRLPYQSDPTVRKEINEGRMQYVDIHLSHVAQYVWFGWSPRCGGDRGGGHPARRAPDSIDLGGQQQDLAGAGRQDHSRSQQRPARRAGRHARYLRRRRAAPAQAHSHGAPVRPHRRAPICTAI